MMRGGRRNEAPAPGLRGEGLIDAGEESEEWPQVEGGEVAMGEEEPWEWERHGEAGVGEVRGLAKKRKRRGRKVREE